jgi:glucan phosphoethanolaminetransferase (alkaline phosphatase superfamily)
MHLYGYKENNTPFLDSLKSMPNFIFAKGISSSVSTRACLQTFFNSFHNPGFLDLIRKKEANLFRLAKHQGYKTFVLSGQNEKLFHDTGTEFVDIFASEKDMRDALNEKGDEALLDKLSMLELGEKNFIVIHLRHVHSPFNAYEKYRPELAKSIDHKNRTSQSQQEYSNAIAYHDYWVKQCILTIIKKMIIDETIYDDRIKPHIQDDTVILFTSDHGQLLGERGLFGHNQMQPEVADVPIWILAPKPALISSLKNQPIISHYDLAKYIATLFGATITNPNENSHLQYVHGSELYANYEFMPWKIEKGQAIFLENQWVDEKKSA